MRRFKIGDIVELNAKEFEDSPDSYTLYLKHKDTVIKIVKVLDQDKLFIDQNLWGTKDIYFRADYFVPIKKVQGFESEEAKKLLTIGYR